MSVYKFRPAGIPTVTESVCADEEDGRVSVRRRVVRRPVPVKDDLIAHGLLTPTMETPEFSVVRTTRTAIEAGMVIAALRSQGHHPLDLETAEHFSLAGAEIAFRVQVPTGEMAEARQFLDTLDASSPPT
jgi:hypothetical protein